MTVEQIQTFRPELDANAFDAEHEVLLKRYVFRVRGEVAKLRHQASRIAARVSVDGDRIDDLAGIDVLLFRSWVGQIRHIERGRIVIRIEQRSPDGSSMIGRFVAKLLLGVVGPPKPIGVPLA